MAEKTIAHICCAKENKRVDIVLFEEFDSFYFVYDFTDTREEQQHNECIELTKEQLKELRDELNKLVL